MVKIYSYQKVTDEYTTYPVTEPDYKEDDERITKLCTIDGVTYISVPDTVVLPTQPKQIMLEELTSTTLTNELITAIKATSTHIRLINQRVVGKIRENYTENDELQMLRLGVGTEYDEYKAYVEACVAWGQAEKVKLGI